MTPFLRKRRRIIFATLLTLLIIMTSLVIYLKIEFKVHFKDEIWKFLARNGLYYKPTPLNYTKNDSTTFLYYYNNISVKKLSNINSNIFIELPDELIIKPGLYLYDGLVYDFTNEGLYRFFNVAANIIVNRIVYESNLFILYSSITLCKTHGNQDIREFDVKDILEILKKKTPNLLCGETALYAKEILKILSIESRIIGLPNLKYKSSYNNSHTINEVFSSQYNKWILIDFDVGVLYKNNITKEYLNYSDISNMKYENIMIERITKYNLSSLTNLRSQLNDYDYGLISHPIFVDDEFYLNWFSNFIKQE